MDGIYLLGRKVGEHLREMAFLDEEEKCLLMFSLGIAAGAMVERDRAEREKRLRSDRDGKLETP
jgi:hypothetical protein